MLSLTILGNNSAIPAFGRNPTSQVLQNLDECFLIDCGEGTQLQLTRYKIRRSKINHIFISHLHGDHYLGLVGLLSTFHLQGRVNELHIFGQQELMDIIEIQLRLSNTILRYSLIFHPVRHYTAEVLLEDEDVLVRSCVLNHRIPCTGFIIREKPRPRKLIIHKIQKYNIPFQFFEGIKNGKDYILENLDIISNEELTEEPATPVSYAYCSDTLYEPDLKNEVLGVNLLYHEATFMHDLLDRAEATYHSTALQASQLAKDAEVGQLLIGHFSARYKDLAPLLQEAKTIFPQTELALEGRKFKIESK